MSAKKKADGFTEYERAAMKERAQELKRQARRNAEQADGENNVLEKIAEIQVISAESLLLEHQ